MATDETRRHDLYEESCARLSAIATQLVQRIEPIDAAGAFLGAGLTLLRAELGTDRAAAYLRDLATNLEQDTEGGHVRH